MSTTADRAFSVNLKVMQIFGFYPTRRYKGLYKIYAYAVYCLLIVPVPLLSCVYLILKNNVDLAQISDNAFIICESGCLVFKFLPFIRNEDEIKNIFSMLECSIFNKYTKGQRNLVEECMRICKRNSYFFLIYYVSTFILWAFAPLVGHELKFPIEVWLPFDATSGPKIFSVVFFCIFVAAGTGATANGAIDPLVSGLTYYAVTQIKLLKDNLQNLDNYAEEEISNMIQGDFKMNSADREIVKSKIIYGKIRFCIDHHNAILNFVKMFENTYSSVVFVQFLASILVICISCLRLSMVHPLSVTFLFMVVFISAMLFQIYAYCYYGTTLFEESNTLTNAVYMGNWYDYDIKSKKALIIFMERSKPPIVVTAGKVLDLSLMTFTMILRRSYSLLAVLKNY